MKKILNAILFLLSFIWQLPQSLIGLVMLAYFKIVGKVRLISYKKLCFCFDAGAMSGGISLGNFAFVSPRLAKKSADVAHEQEGHTWDSKLFGPLYLFVIGLPSLIHASMNNYECYFDFYTERWANKHADVEVLKTADGRCFLSKKNIVK